MAEVRVTSAPEGPTWPWVSVIDRCEPEGFSALNGRMVNSG